MTKLNTPLVTSKTDWSESLLREVWSHIEDIAKNDLKLDFYTPQIEIISAEQMIDAYASSGLPVHYNHWSFGKHFLKDWGKYQNGQMGLAYEIVINSNPCISYLMEENNAITQALVMAHAAAGHSHVFKNNYLFAEHSTAGSIIDYMIFAKAYVRQCEEKYGEDAVELIMDAAHSIASHGVDKSHRKHVKKMSEEEFAKSEMRKLDEEHKNLDIIMQRTTIKVKTVADDIDLDLVGDEENLLYFIYKKAPNMEPWKRELLRIVYKIHQYFYPSSQTKTLHEGFATHTHYYIMNELEHRGIISADAQLAWLHLHSSVIYQPQFGNKHYDGFNPYALGFSLFKEIRRICEEPTAEDREWFPNLVGKDWREEHKNAVANYRDESLIEQFLSPKLMREMRLFSIVANKDVGTVSEITDDIGYSNLRRQLASQYNTINRIPDIVVKSAKMRSNRILTLEYRPFKKRDLHKPYIKETLEYVRLLWGYSVELVNENNIVIADTT